MWWRTKNEKIVFSFFFLRNLRKRSLSKNLNEKNVRLNEYKKKLNFQHFEKQIAISIKNLKINSIIFSKIKILFKCCLSKLFYLKSLFFIQTSVSFVFNWIEEFAIKIFFANSNENSNDNDNLFDQTFIYSSFSSVMNFVVFDTNKFDEKFQFFVFTAEKKSEFFDMHREFSKSFNFDDKIKNVATAKMKKDFVPRDLTNRKLTELLKTFFFSIFKKHRFSLKKMFSIFWTFMTNCTLNIKLLKKRKLNVCINIVNSLYFCLFKTLRLKTTWNEKKIRIILRQKYKNKNFIQQIIIFSYLKILKNEKRIDFEKINKYIRKYIAVFERFLKKNKLQLRMQNKWFLQKLSENFVLNFVKKINYDDDDDEMIFFDVLKNIVWKLVKSFKIFKKIRIFNQLTFEMTKLIKKIENADDFRNSISENEFILKHSIVNNRIDNMIKIMKKMIFNVNVFMNEIVQQQKHQIRYFQLSSKNSFMQQMQIMRRFEKFNQHAFFFLNLKSTVCRIIRSKLFFINRINQSFSKKINRIFTKTINF